MITLLFLTVIFLGALFFGLLKDHIELTKRVGILERLNLEANQNLINRVEEIEKHLIL